MLDKLKTANKLRKMKSEMEKQLQEVFHTEEKGMLKVVVRGDKYIERIEIDGEERKDIKTLINDGLKGAEKKAEKKMKSNPDALMELFGGLQ